MHRIDDFSEEIKRIPSRLSSELQAQSIRFDGHVGGYLWFTDMKSGSPSLHASFALPEVTTVEILSRRIAELRGQFAVLNRRKRK